MLLNTIAPAIGAKRNAKRVGRGIGSGLGKTCGRGHKGQKSRAGGFHKVGFEGGQMPLQRRLPKRGFNSRNKYSELRLSDLNDFEGEINKESLITAGLVSLHSDRIKIINTGNITKALLIRGIAISASAKLAITNAGGTVI